MVNQEVWSVHDIEELPAGRKAIGSRWVYTTKFNKDGSIERYKARLVVKGYSQISGVDYNETFAPVTRYNSLRLIIALAAQLDLGTSQLDIKSAFTYGSLDEEIWIEPPPRIGLDNKILYLEKALYGLKQASRQWNIALMSVLVEIDLIQSTFDPCVWFSTRIYLFICFYVDDILVVGSDSERASVTAHLHIHFTVTDKGPLFYMLGIEITITNDAYYLGQSLYID